MSLARLLPVLLCIGASAPAPDAPVYFAQEQRGIGDPNPYFEDGVYSVFYLKNEGRHPFWMTQTRDLQKWSPAVESIPVGGPEAPDYWTGSGSIIRDPHGGYRLYYTGHHPERHPKEVVMEARSTSLNGPWRKQPTMTFDGSGAYDAMDFRDPYVFWNWQAQSYWMVLTTRKGGDAVIGLYTSKDLTRWTPEHPLYQERSPLNLEVPDLFQDNGDWYILYSDQREQFRQVRYLQSDNSAGQYHNGRWDALDGRAFYAGKSAGTGNERLLFGWVASKLQHRDGPRFDWGGDLVVHALRRTPEGDLAVDLPKGIEQQFSRERGRLSIKNRRIGFIGEPLLVQSEIKVEPGSVFTMRFDGAKIRSRLAFDTGSGKASFNFIPNDPFAPSVSFPLASDGRYEVDVVLDPNLGLGVAYINHFRALSFRLYGMLAASATLEGDKMIALRGAVRTHLQNQGLGSHPGD